MPNPEEIRPRNERERLLAEIKAGHPPSPEALLESGEACDAVLEFISEADEVTKMKMRTIVIQYIAAINSQQRLITRDTQARSKFAADYFKIPFTILATLGSVAWTGQAGWPVVLAMAAYFYALSMVGFTGKADLNRNALYMDLRTMEKKLL
ncbi:hypothetical protein HY968_04775 [Candidatus Kaiserbacteria bacterium]|nr:hypothetical protein [Candidatus Kaiserbacteria bacterium]